MRARKRKHNKIVKAKRREWVNARGNGLWAMGKGRSKDCWIAKRIMIKRMPSSIREKAQISTEPKARGVKMIKEIRMNLIRLFNIKDGNRLWDVGSLAIEDSLRIFGHHLAGFRFSHNSGCSLDCGRKNGRSTILGMGVGSNDLD
jgi:hypothetical protein